jgi:hypothetical protein
MATIRQRKDGGCSICYASDENVGKRRCCHVLDGATMNVRHVKGMNFVDISGKMDDNDAQFSIKASENDIKDYISSLSKGLSKKQKDKILETMRNL